MKYLGEKKEGEVMLSIFRWFLVSVFVVMVTACGGGGSSSVDVSDQGAETDTSIGGSTSTPDVSNTETYIDNNGDIVPVLSEKPDVKDIDIGDGDRVRIRIIRNINLNSGFAKSALSKYSAPHEVITLNYTNVAVDIDVKCEDYGFDQSDLGFSQTFESGIKYKIYDSKREYIDNTHYYNISCEESDFESTSAYANVAGKYTIVQSDIWRM